MTAQILLTEDDKFLSKIYKANLEEAGYAVLLAHDGDEALSIMKSEKPKLVLLDMLMPKKDGFEVLEIMAKDAALKKIPVIALTSLGQESDIQKAKDLGAKDYCSKTESDMSVLLEKVRHFLHT